MLSPGDKFPAFAVDTVNHGRLDIAEYLRGAYGTILVSRGAWCPYCVAQLRNFKRAKAALDGEDIKVIAFSVDDRPTAIALADRVGAPFPVGYGADAHAFAALTGAFVNEEPEFLQSTGFVLDPDGLVLVSVYSSGAIGRLVPDDVIGLIRYTKSSAAARHQLATTPSADPKLVEGRVMTGYPTTLGRSDADTINLLGQDLAADLMGKVGFGELVLWMVNQRRPTPSEVRVFESVLVALADHGFTPTAIAARLTYLSAPDSLQGAIAAGLLGGGSRFLGVTEDCGQYLAAVLAAAPAIPTGDVGFDALALAAVQRARAEKKFIPGLGHPVHKIRDPRTQRLIAIAAEENLRGPHLRLFEAIGRMHPQVLGRTLPLNGAGVCGAVLADIGLPKEMLRGFALLARTGGLLGQLAEEQRTPISSDIYMHVDRNAIYVPPQSR
jgi:citrate synthase